MDSGVIVKREKLEKHAQNLRESIKSLNKFSKELDKKLSVIYNFARGLNGEWWLDVEHIIDNHFAEMQCKMVEKTEGHLWWKRTYTVRKHPDIPKDHIENTKGQVRRFIYEGYKAERELNDLHHQGRFQRERNILILESHGGFIKT